MIKWALKIINNYKTYHIHTALESCQRHGSLSMACNLKSHWKQEIHIMKYFVDALTAVTFL